MTFFRSFTFPLWEIFAGNLLLLVCSLLYLAWWADSFRPHAAGGSAATFYIMAAFITGSVAIGLMGTGINSLADYSKGVPVKFIVAGAVLLFTVLLLITSVLFHRAVTSELLIIHLWAALELSALAVLSGTGRLGPARAAVLAALVGIVTAAALVCYLLYYRLDETARYHVGMVPLITDAVVMTVFLAVLAVS